MKNKGLMYAIIAVAVVVVGAVLFYGILGNRDDMLTLEKAKQTIESRYGGYVSSIELVDDEYVATLTNGNNNYQVILDDDTGETLSYTQIQTNTASNNTNEANDKNKNENENQNQNQQADQTSIEDKIAQAAPGKLVVLEQVGNASLNKYKAIVINGNTKHELDIDGNTNVIVSHDIDKETKLSEPSILGKEAVEIAKKEVAGQVDDIDLSYEGGTLVYDVEINTGPDQDVDVYIDANTGKVVRVDRY